MKVKLLIKGLLKGLELAATLWAVGVAVGVGFRAGQKVDDSMDMMFYDIIKARKIKGLQKKLQKISKKEQLTEEDKKAQIDLLADIVSWQSIDTRDLSCLGTSIPGGFNINYHKEEKE